MNRVWLKSPHPINGFLFAIHRVPEPSMPKERATSEPEVPERLLVADWDDLVPRIRLWAHHFHKRYLRHIRAAPTPDDLVQEAIVKLYTGRRKIPDHVPLLTVLINNIQSDIWNFLTKEGYTSKDSKGKGRKGWGRHIGLEEWVEKHDEKSIPPDNELKGLRNTIIEKIEDDEMLIRMMDLIFQDPLLKPRDLARLLEISVKEVNNAQKRLRRRLGGLRDTLK